MCGISGAILTNKTYEWIGVDGPALLARQLGLAMQVRGGDATGIARFTQGGRYKVAKLDVPASKFFSSRKGIGANSRAFIVHTRAMTQGAASNPLNNHPIVYNNVVGIHNGWITNDDDIFRDFQLPRHGQVDSEAIFAAIASLGWKKALETIEGAAAVAWFDTLTDRLHLARQDGYSPLFYGFSRWGDLIFSSTEAATYSVLREIDPLVKIADVEEMKVGEEMSFHLITGDVEIDEFEPAEKIYKHWNSGSTHSDGWDNWDDHRIPGFTTWSVREGASTFQKIQSASPPDVMEQTALLPGDTVLFTPQNENSGYEMIVGRVHRVGWQRADVDLWIDEDIILRASLPLDRLDFVDHGDEEKSKDLVLVSSVEEPAGLMRGDGPFEDTFREGPFDVFDDDEGNELFDGLSPSMQKAVAFLATQAEEA